jgi:hypothetical protein
MSSHVLLAAWLVALFTSWVPGFDYDQARFRDARETNAQTQERYTEIATAIATVVLDPTEAPIANSRDRTALALATIAYYESSLARNVDLGIGKYAKGDFGRSACLAQINVGKGTTTEGWTANDLINDRTKCFRASLHLLRASWACGHGAERWTPYASGRCVTNDAWLEEQDPKAKAKLGSILNTATYRSNHHNREWRGGPQAWAIRTAWRDPATIKLDILATTD